MPTYVHLSPEERGGLTIYPVTPLLHLGITAFLTSRDGGISRPPYDTLNLGDHVGDDPVAVAHNRALVANVAGVEPERLVIARQVHGHHVASVIAPRHDLEADGLATGHPNIAVAVLVADCVPIALADDTGRVCVVHAGWRGLAAGVVQAAIDQFDEPWHVKAFVGPRVSPAVYQVGPEVAATFANVRGAVLPDEGDRSRLDLVTVALEALQRAAVLDDNVAVCDNVTDGGATFFSDRAQRPCGRVGLVLRPTTYDGRVRSQR